MKLLISVCDTKHVERGHRSLRFTVNEIMILSVTISYVKREWISVVNIPHCPSTTKRNNRTHYVMGTVKCNTCTSCRQPGSSPETARKIHSRNYLTLILDTAAFKFPALLHSITAHYHVAKLHSITAHYYVAKLHSITAHYYVAKFLCRTSQYIRFIPQRVILCPDYDA